MFKEDILKKLISDFGETQAILYCRMESAKNAYLFQECIDNGEDLTCMQYDYERDWWHSAYEKLSNNIKTN
jgi:hypothetical protein